MSTVLSAQAICLSFGGLQAIADFSLDLSQGALHGLIGPNGAGKTTVFNLFTGIYKPHRGNIFLLGENLLPLKPFQIASRGIARTFQNIRLFSQLSVLDNVRLAAHLRIQYGFAATLLRTPQQIRSELEIERFSRELLKIFDLLPRAEELPKNLPYGEQRNLEIARALATQPKVLLLDEPAAGMNLREKRHLLQLIRFIRDEFHLTILLIEHDMGVVMDCCEQITVLDHGEIIASGKPQEIQNNPKVIEAYLGVPEENAAARS